MRAIMLAAYVIIVCYAIQTLLRWLLQTPPRPRQAEPAYGEMVLDPECRVYILKKHAVTKRIRGNVLYFCNDDCAAVHAARNRD